MNNTNRKGTGGAEGAHCLTLGLCRVRQGRNLICFPPGHKDLGSEGPRAYGPLASWRIPLFLSASSAHPPDDVIVRTRAEDVPGAQQTGGSRGQCSAY